jgi:hypothetical protein
VGVFLLNDLFLVGLAMDMTGGWLLGRGLLVSPIDLARRAGSFAGENPYAVVSAANDKVDGYFGLGALGGGFLLQAIGYVFLIGRGGANETGWCRAVVALALGVLAGAAVLAAWRYFRHRLLLRTLLGPAHMEYGTGKLADKPFAPRLNGFAEAMGYERHEEEDSVAFAQRVFGTMPMYPTGYPSGDQT